MRTIIPRLSYMHTSTTTSRLSYIHTITLRLNASFDFKKNQKKTLRLSAGFSSWALISKGMQQPIIRPSSPPHDQQRYPIAQTVQAL